MYVKNRMTKQPVCIDVNSKISQVVDIMNEKNLHRIPVVSGKKTGGTCDRKHDFKKWSQQGDKFKYL